MTWDGRDQHAPFGDTARNRPGGAAAPGVVHEVDCERWFPPHRSLYPGRPGSQGESFPRYQAATVTLAANASFQLVIMFAGRPDRIDIAGSVAGVVFRLRNRGDDEADAIRIVGPQWHETYISKEIVEAQDPTGAGGQIVSVHGMWTEPWR